MYIAQQWELGQLGQGKDVARGNPGLIIQSLDDYTSNYNWYSIYKLDCILYATLLAKNNLVAKTFVSVHKIAYI